MQYSRWNHKTFRWGITSHADNLQAVRAYFGDRLLETKVADHHRLPSKAVIPPKNALVIQPTTEGRLRLIFRYHKVMIRFIKELPYPLYDPGNRWWSVPDTEKIRVALLAYTEKIGWQAKYLDKKQKTLGKTRPKPEDLPNYRRVPAQYTEQLRIKRYSLNTFAPIPICLKSSSRRGTATIITAMTPKRSPRKRFCLTCDIW